MANRTKWTEIKKTKFLDALREQPNVSRACRMVGLSRSGVYEQRENDAEFAKAWDEAWQDGIDALEEIADERARKGSDVLLIFRLKALRPDVYRETTRLEHTGGDGGAIQMQSSITLEGLNDDDIDRILQQARISSAGGKA